MSSLESRIHAAAQSVADEVTPTDIPPLRLPPQSRRVRSRPGDRRLRAAGRPRNLAGLPGSRRRNDRPGAGDPRSGFRWLAPLAAAVSLAAVLTGLVAARHADSTAARGSWQASASLSRAEKLQVKRALDAYFPATGAQYTAGLAFAWTRQTILAAKAGPCLDQAGSPLPSFPSSRPQYQLSFPDNGQFPDLRQRTRTHRMAPAGGDVRSDQARPWAHADRPGAPPAATSCVARYTHSLWRLDTVAAPLAGAWLRQVAAIQSSAPVRAKQAGFVSCLESFGVPARFATSRGHPGHRLFTGFFAWMNWLGASSGSPQALCKPAAALDTGVRDLRQADCDDDGATADRRPIKVF